MSDGKFLHRPEPPHVCQPPSLEYPNSNTGPITTGSVWQCSCELKTTYLLRYTPDRQRHAFNNDFSTYYQPAHWWELGAFRTDDGEWVTDSLLHERREAERKREDEEFARKVNKVLDNELPKRLEKACPKVTFDAEKAEPETFKKGIWRK